MANEVLQHQPVQRIIVLQAIVVALLALLTLLNSCSDPLDQNLTNNPYGTSINIKIQFRDFETNEPIKGTFWLLDQNYVDILTELSDTNGCYYTDQNGYFELTLPYRISHFKKIIIQGGIGEPNDLTVFDRVYSKLSESYIRTVVIDPIRTENHVEIVPVPFGPYADKPLEFHTYSYVINKIARFDVTGLREIRIVESDSASGGTFTQEQIDRIKAKFLDVNDIGGVIGKQRFLPETFVVGDRYIDSLNVQHSIVITPVKDLTNGGRPIGGLASFGRAPGSNQMTWGRVWIDPALDQKTFEAVISHEMGHILLLASHTAQLSGESIMTVTADTALTTMGPAELWISRIIYHDAYLVPNGEGAMYPLREIFSYFNNRVVRAAP